MLALSVGFASHVERPATPMRQKIPQLDAVRGTAILACFKLRLDGGGPLLRAVGFPDHRHSAGFEIVGELLPELLCPAFSSNLAAVLFHADPDVCNSPAGAAARCTRSFSTIHALVVVSVLSAEFSGGITGIG